MKTKAQLRGMMGPMAKEIKRLRIALQRSELFRRHAEKKVIELLPELLSLRTQRSTWEAKYVVVPRINVVSVKQENDYLRGRLGELNPQDQAIFDAQQAPLEFGAH